MMVQGHTRILCTASVSTDLPRWLAGKGDQPPTRGWVTAEYSMLPGSTSQRKRRGPDSRGTEIQRLIARSLRAAVDLTKMPGVIITCDCDVIVADGGTRTASITGAYVALVQAVRWARQQQIIPGKPILGPVAGWDRSNALADRDAIPRSWVGDAMKKYGIDPEKPNPVTT